MFDKKNIYSRNTPLGAVIFTIVSGADGKPEILEISDENYKKEDIVLQPIN